MAPAPRHAIWIPAVLAALAPTSADAHLVATGMGPIYAGVTHFGLSPEDFLPVIGLALLAGLRGPYHARATLAVVVFAWFAGGLLAFTGIGLPPLALPMATALLYLLIGGVLSANLKLPPAFCAAIAAGLGLVRGFADLEGVAASGAHALTLFGMGASVFAVFALATSLTLPMRRLWMIVATRVGGSWLAALGLLFAGWIIRFGAVVK